MKIDKIDLNGNFNIGLFVYSNDSFCLIGNDIMDEDVDLISKILSVPVYRINMVGTSLPGIFIAGNSSKILVPEVIYPEEEELLNLNNIEYLKLNTHLSALGNNILMNDNGAIVNPNYSDDVLEKIRNYFNIPVVRSTLLGLETVGSLGVANNNGVLIPKDSSQEEERIVKETLKVPVYRGTINLGNNYIHSGVICNNNGILVGKASGGVEITDVDNALRNN